MLRSTFLALTLPLSCFAQSNDEEISCLPSKGPCRAALRHIEGGGIGYKHGYTTLEAFLATDPSRWRVTPFLDARGHIFNNGKWAANAGLGLRILSGERIYGVSTYYDYRNGGHLDANQIGVGLETLGEIIDFRLNGYLPVGRKVSPFYDTTFESFSGNYVLISQKYQFAMKGADAEVGLHFDKSSLFNFYAAAGPYYFIGKGTSGTWGGKGRVSGTYRDTLSLELSDSYDKTFHNNFQVELTLTLAFGPKITVKREGRSCKVAHRLNDRMLQPVGRKEIIILDKATKTSVAIDPTTGNPYTFVFVDNTSHSKGTYESPYPTLAQAEENSLSNDIIYVFPGDGTTTGMDSGITLKPNQKFWGSASSYSIQTTQGAITLPQQTSSPPTITNTDIDTEGHAIILATNNAINGFTITSPISDAIYGADQQNLTISSCTIKESGVFAIEAVFLEDAALSITNNQFLNNANGVFATFNGTSNFACLDNVFKGQTSISEVPVNIAAANNSLTVAIKNNIFDSNETGSVRLNLDSVVNLDVNLTNNTITNNNTGSQSSLASSFAIIPTGTTARCSIVAENNTFSQNGSNSLYFHTSGAFATLEVTASKNNISDNQGSAFVLATPADTLTLLAADNTIARSGDNGISVISSTLITTGNIAINDNSFTDITNGNGIAINQSFTTLALTIANNEINNCDGTGIISYAPVGIDSFTLYVSDNTISNCQNLFSNAAAGLDIEQYTNFLGFVTNNTFSGNASLDVMVGSTLPAPVAHLTLTDNKSSADYLLSNPFDGLFNLSPCDVNTTNTGTINTSGVITPVQSHLTNTPCPP
jgi:hypothetical protein